MRRAIVLWVAQKLFTNRLLGLYTVLFELHDGSLKFQLFSIKQVMNGEQLMENKNIKPEQVHKLNIYKFKPSHNHLHIHNYSDPANTHMHINGRICLSLFGSVYLS